MLVTPTSLAGVAADSQLPNYTRADRRASAYRFGEVKARARLISADAYLFLYKELVNLCGERSYCWPGLEYLAAILETSEGTIKRWMRELERANLILRKPRPGGRTSLTYITAYLEGDDHVDDAVADDVPIEPSQALDVDTPPPTDAPRARRARVGTPNGGRPSADASFPIHGLQDQGSGQLFFGPRAGITSDRSTGSASIPHSVKSHESKTGGCGTHGPAKTARTQSDPEAMALLTEHGILGDDAVAELQARPIAELEAVSRYVDRQRNVVNPAGLFVWLVRKDFGAALLAAPGRAKAHTRSDRLRTPKMGRGLARPATVTTTDNTQELWDTVLRTMQPSVSAEEYATWLEPTMLLALDQDRLVVGVPNVFVRDRIAGAMYDALIADAIRTVVGRSLRVEIVIDG